MSPDCRVWAPAAIDSERTPNFVSMNRSPETPAAALSYTVPMPGTLSNNTISVGSGSTVQINKRDAVQIASRPRYSSSAVHACDSGECRPTGRKPASSAVDQSRGLSVTQ